MLVTQRKSKTFITNLGQGKIFGEIGFFTGRPRTVTIKSKGFSELMYLDKYKFLKYITQSKFMISALKEFEEIAMKMLE
jgi:CRP-like cAMP-binding protein|tara:strand:- start:603 stop:839 length:237 start_codon:yes stop_codon:yes gene_type:complete